MGGGAFILLKAGLSGPETAKQAEIRLAGLLKILAIGPLHGEKFLAKGSNYVQWLCWRDFRGIWLIRPGWPFLLSKCHLNHSFSREIGAVCCMEMQEEDQANIDVRPYRI